MQSKHLGMVEIQERHVGKGTLEVNGKMHFTAGLFGRFKRTDVGKRVYLTQGTMGNEYLQMENDKQRGDRLQREEAARFMAKEAGPIVEERV